MDPNASLTMASKLWRSQPETSTTLVVASTVVATVSVLALLRSKLYPTRPSIMPSPLKTLLPKLSGHEKKELLYGPDYFPGARDVETPVCGHTLHLYPNVCFRVSHRLTGHAC